jgi:hypothetical protein
MNQSIYGKISIYCTPSQCHRSTRSHYLHQLSESASGYDHKKGRKRLIPASMSIFDRGLCRSLSPLMSLEAVSRPPTSWYVSPFSLSFLEEEARTALTVAKPSPTTHINRRSPSLQIRPRIHRPLGRIPNDSLPSPRCHTR